MHGSNWRGACDPSSAAGKPFANDCVVTVNPIVPYTGPLENILDHFEQLYRKLIYSRLKAVEAYIDDDIKERTVHLESKPQDFFYNMLRVDKMKEGLFEGYYQTLKYCAENYVAETAFAPCLGVVMVIMGGYAHFLAISQQVSRKRFFFS